MANVGFELGNLSGWSTTDAANAVAYNENHWGLAANAGHSRSQLYGVKLSGGVDGVQQTITGLTSFKKIVIGDLWSGNTNTAYFDDIAIQ